MITKIRALWTLVVYCFRRFPLFYVCLTVSLAAVLLELAAIASLIPLAEFGAGRAIPAESRWAHVLAAFGATPDIKAFATLFLGLLITRIAAHLATSILASLFFRKLIAHLSSTAFTVFVTKLSFSEIHKKSIGYYLNLAGEEANRASQIINGVVRLVPAMFLVVLYFALIMSQSIILAICVIAFLLLSLALLRGSFHRSHQLGGQQQMESRALNSHFIESLSALRSVKAFTAEHFVAARYETMIGGYAKTCFRIDAINALARFAPALILVALVAIGALIWVDDDSLRTHFSMIVVMLVLLMRFFPVTGQSLDIFLKIVADLRSGQEVVDVVARIEELRAAELATETLACPAIDTIQFKNVTFSYANGVRPVSQLTLLLERGQSYALVGPSGAGKSTVFDLLLKYIHPQGGVILINGVGIGAYSDLSLRGRVALVEQQVRIFNDTLLHNITLGMDIPASKVLQACSQAGLDPLVSSLPDGLSTLLDYQGSNLSGGQRQRIGLARALARDPDVLLLDESTNALDRSTRDEIVERILSLYERRIVVFATHDEAVISQTDVIVDLPGVVKAPAAAQNALDEYS